MTIRKSGYVAMLDILGFADRVTQQGAAGLDSYIDTVTELAERYPNLGTILFSDTVVLYTFNDSPHAFHEIVSMCSKMLFALLQADVPLRGAISHGDFARSENDVHGTVIAGRPIIEAHYYESQQQWVGIMLTRSIIRHVRDLATRTSVNCSSSSKLSPTRYPVVSTSHKL